MQNVQVEQTRNFAIIGHSGDGKTSLGEALLHRAGAIAELGRVEEGTSVLNHLPEERTGHHTASVTSHLYSFDWHDHHITLVDTPGDPSFQGDGDMTLQALDAGVVVVDAGEGVKSGTQRMIDQARDLGLSLIVFVNGLDRERGDLEQAVASLAESGIKPVLLSLPLGEPGSLGGAVDLLRGCVVAADGGESDLPEALEGAVSDAREQLADAVAECDDVLLEKYLEEGELSAEELATGLRVGTRGGALVPVFCGSATAEIGVDALLTAIVDLLPSPADRGPWAAREVEGDAEVQVEPSPDAPFSALLFKTIIDRYAGTLSVLRVVSGRLTHDTGVLNAVSGRKTRAGKLFLLRGEQHVDASDAGPGDIVAVAKMKDVATADVLTCEKGGVRLPQPKKPEGVISYAVEAAEKADEDKVFSALARLAEEDPAIRIGREPSTGEFLLTGMGELHIRTTAHKLKRVYNVEMKLKTPTVPYRETVTKRVEHVEGKLKKQTGGAGMFGVCYIDLEPLPRASGFVFDDRIVGGAIPRGLIPAVEKGVIEACAAGPLAGYPVVDIKVACVDGKYHSVDSNEMAFKLAGSFALKAAVEKAGPVLLEPYMTVEVSVPDECVGDVMGDISSRRGTVQTTEARGHAAVVVATVPMAEMLEYAPILTSITGGKGEFTMRFSHYDPIGGRLAEKVIEQSKAKE